MICPVFLKFSDFPRNHNEIYFSGKCYIKLVGFKMIHINISKNENHFPHISKKEKVWWQTPSDLFLLFLLCFKQIIDQFMSL